MAQKSREDLTALVDQKVYDNTQKEILASMMREVLKDFKDSHFNWISDELKTAMYNSTQTLEQYLNTVTGSVPRRGRIVNVDVGNNGRPANIDIASNNDVPNGIITSASYVHRESLKCQIKIVTSIPVNTRMVIPVLRTPSKNNWQAQTTLGACVMVIDSSHEIHLNIRELSPTTQNLDIEIIVM